MDETQEPIDEAETLRMLNRLITLRRDYVASQQEFDRIQVEYSDIKAVLASHAQEYLALRTIVATQLKNRIDNNV